MQIQWLGHSCFLIISSTGTRVLTDPFNEKVGYKLPDVKADIVTTSHNHYDHNNIGIVKGSFTHLSTAGKYVVKDIELNAIPTWHDNEKGALRGANLIFRLKMDGLTLCHCGDLGHMPAQATLDEIGHVDVFMVPVGGVYTINAQKASELVKALEPAITIPMHYKTPALSFELEPVDSFLKLAGMPVKTGVPYLELSTGNLKSFGGVVVPKYDK